MHKNGQGVPQNFKEAVRWFTKAAEQGDADAQFYLGVMHEEGQGSMLSRVSWKFWVLVGELSASAREHADDGLLP